MEPRQTTTFPYKLKGKRIYILLYTEVFKIINWWKTLLVEYMMNLRDHNNQLYEFFYEFEI